MRRRWARVWCWLSGGHQPTVLWERWVMLAGVQYWWTCAVCVRCKTCLDSTKPPV